MFESLSNAYCTDTKSQNVCLFSQIEVSGGYNVNSKIKLYFSNANKKAHNGKTENCKP